jgi:hypothetical protein
MSSTTDCGDEIRGISPIKRLEKSDVDYLKRGRQNLHEFKYLMAKLDAEATRLGKEVRSGSRVHYKSIFFLCKRVLLGSLAAPKTGDRGGLKLSLGLQQSRLLDARQRGNTF